MTAVYVIDQADGKATKVGIADDLARRLKGIQCGNPQEVRVHFALELGDRATAARVEMAAHTVLRRVRLKGEWFGCDAATAKAAVLRAAGRSGTPIPCQPFWRGRKVGA